MSNNIKGQTVRNSLTSLLFFFCLILAACSVVEPPTSEPTTEPGSPEPRATEPQVSPTRPRSTEPALGEMFSLTVGQEAKIAGTGLAFTFDEVERDGRCPSAVLCSESGPVVILISAAIGEQFSTQYEMNPDPNLAALSGMPPNVITHNKYEIELTAVEPYPEQPEDLMNLPYSATFIVRESSAQENLAAKLNNPFVLKEVQSADILGTDLKITFDEVVSDGRCPSGVNCVANGPVTIRVSVVDGNQSPAQFDMNPDPNLATFAGIAPNIVTYQGYEIELTAVDPYPEQPEDLMNLPYEATFIVRESSAEGNLVATVGNPFVLKVNQSADIQGTNNISITFDSVELDWRCPSEVECETAGPVVIVITVMQEGGSPATYRMNPDAGFASEDDTIPNIVSLSRLDIELTAVNPYPAQPEDIMNLPYEATFVVR